jgi:hypothetical protein
VFPGVATAMHIFSFTLLLALLQLQFDGIVEKFMS